MNLADLKARVATERDDEPTHGPWAVAAVVFAALVLIAVGAGLLIVAFMRNAIS